MIAIDTNILVYAHRRDSEFHKQAKAVLTNLAENKSSWAIPWSCIHEFMAVTTHSKIFSPPSKISEASKQVGFWLESPSLRLLKEEDDYWKVFSNLLTISKTTGAAIHDARIAAVCLTNGVNTIYSLDRDFSRFKPLKVLNPLI